MSAERRFMLRQALARVGPICAAGVHDGISARVADTYGFDALYMTGNGAVASALGLPDLGLASATEMIGMAATIAGASRTPLIADADTGYGGVINVRRTVHAYEDAGVCAIQIEDQQSPKRCGQSFAREVVEIDEMVAKVRSAVESRRDPNLLIIARTDALQQYGMDGALQRAEAYAAAGADILLIEGLAGEGNYRTAARSLSKPLVALIVDGRGEPAPNLDEIAAWGARLVIYPSIGMLAAAKAYHDVYAGLKRTGDTRALQDRLLAFQAFMELMDAPAWQKFEHDVRSR